MWPHHGPKLAPQTNNQPRQTRCVGIARRLPTRNDPSALIARTQAPSRRAQLQLIDRERTPNPKPLHGSPNRSLGAERVDLIRDRPISPPAEPCQPPQLQVPRPSRTLSPFLRRPYHCQVPHARRPRDDARLRHRVLTGELTRLSHNYRSQPVKHVPGQHIGWLPV